MNVETISPNQKEQNIIPEEVEDLMGYYFDKYENIYEQDAGVSEGYTLEEHTRKVLRQFEKYFGESALPDSVDSTVFRKMLILHDIGKPDSSEKLDQSEHHEESSRIIEEELSEEGHKEDQINIASALVSADPIGEFVQTSVEETIDELENMREKTSLDREKFWKLIMIFYKSDAASYTEDAGGQEGLEHLFKNLGEEAKREGLKFAGEQNDKTTPKGKIEKLKERYVGLMEDLKRVSLDPSTELYHGTDQPELVGDDFCMAMVTGIARQYADRGEKGEVASIKLEDGIEFFELSPDAYDDISESEIKKFLIPNEDNNSPDSNITSRKSSVLDDVNYTGSARKAIDKYADQTDYQSDSSPGIYQTNSGLHIYHLLDEEPIQQNLRDKGIRAVKYEDVHPDGDFDCYRILDRSLIEGVDWS